MQRTIPVANDLGNNVLTVPLDKVFIKQRIDLLTAKAWLLEEQSLEKEVTSLSLEYGVPSAHTKLCAFETTEAKQKQMEQDKKKGGGSNVLDAHATAAPRGAWSSARWRGRVSATSARPPPAPPGWSRAPG